MADNGFSDKVTIVHGKAEEVMLPVDKVSPGLAPQAAHIFSWRFK